MRVLGGVAKASCILFGKTGLVNILLFVVVGKFDLSTAVDGSCSFNLVNF
jgi:hypothetical protein